MGVCFYIAVFMQQLLRVFVEPWHLLAGMFFFVTVIAAIIIFILLYLVRRSTRTARRLQLRNQYSELISLLAICETELELQELMKEADMQRVLQNLFKDRFARKVLIGELVKTINSMSGTAADNVCWFYEQAGLEKDSLERLQNGNWHVKARAIQELAALRQTKYITKIYRLTNHKHELVRSEARTAVVKLTGFEGLRFLDVISYPLTEWQHLCLLHELSKQKNQSFEAIPRWIDSPNYNVVEFALRLIEVYKLYELHNQVVPCLLHPVKSVRKKAIEAIKEISEPHTAAILISIFQQEDDDLQLLILQVLKETGTEAELAFLLQQLMHPLVECKAAAVKAILHIQPAGLKMIEQHIQPDQYPWNILLLQLKQEQV